MPGARAYNCVVAGHGARIGRLFVQLLGVLQAFFFNVHVVKFVRVEDLTAFQTFYKFGIFFAG